MFDETLIEDLIACGTPDEIVGRVVRMMVFAKKYSAGETEISAGKKEKRLAAERERKRRAYAAKTGKSLEEIDGTSAGRRRGRPRKEAKISAISPQLFAEKSGETPLSFLTEEKKASEIVVKKETVKEEKQVSTEYVEKRRSAKKPKLSVDSWTGPKPGHYESARRDGLTNEDVLREAENMRWWAQSKDEVKVNWDAAFYGWLRRTATQRGGNGSRPSVPSVRRQRTLADAFNDAEANLATRQESKRADDPLTLDLGPGEFSFAGGVRW